MAGMGQGNTPPFNDPGNPGWYTDPYAKKPEQPAPPSNRGMPPAPQGPHAQQVPGRGTYAGPGYAPPYAAPRPQEKKGLSIAALASGITALMTMGVLFIPQILAIVFGHLALRREPAGRALALTGLIMGYAVAALWAVLLFFIIVGAAMGSIGS